MGGAIYTSSRVKHESTFAMGEDNQSKRNFYLGLYLGIVSLTLVYFGVKNTLDREGKFSNLLDAYWSVTNDNNVGGTEFIFAEADARRARASKKTKSNAKSNPVDP